jgi:hypothetical protein
MALPGAVPEPIAGFIVVLGFRARQALLTPVEMLVIERRRSAYSAAGPGREQEPGGRRHQRD